MPGKITLHKAYAGVTVAANVANAWSTVFKYLVPNRTMITVKDGDVLKLKLRTNVPADIEMAAEIMVAYRVPGVVREVEVSQKSYMPWYNLSLTEQQNVDNQAMITIEIPQGSLSLLEQRELCLLVKAAAVIDWTQATTQIFWEVEEVAV